MSKLTLPDNESIQDGTAQLREAFKSTQAIPELCSVLATSSKQQIRQYAALLLRKKFCKTRTWMRVSAEGRALLKEGCLGALLAEADSAVKVSIAQLVAVLAKHELRPGGGPHSWPELSTFLSHHLNCPDQRSQLLGMCLVSVLCDVMGDQVRPLVGGQFGRIFQRALQSGRPDVGFYAVKAVTSLAQHVGADDPSLFQLVVGPVIQFVTRLVAGDDEARAAEAMEVFDELFESQVTIVGSHIRTIVDLCLKIAQTRKLNDALRVKAICLLGRITRLKKKAIVKQKLYVQIIDTLFPIMSIITDSDLEEESEVESASPSLCACQTLDVLAVNLPPEKFMCSLLSHVHPALQGNDPEKRKGAFNALAVCAEGCAEHIRNKYLVSFLHAIGNGIRDESIPVRNAALYALGQYSEYLQPDISNYASDLVPILLQYLDAHCVSGSRLQTVAEIAKDPKSLHSVFYALEIFCENLEEKVVPYLPEIMKRLLFMMGENFAERTREFAISATGAVANAAKAAIIPYFDEIMLQLKKFIFIQRDSSRSDSQSQTLLTQSMDTLGVLARSVGPASFAPTLAEECCKLGLEVISSQDDPDIRKCAFSLFSSVAFVVNNKMMPVLPKITELLLHSCNSKEGISFEFKDASDLQLEDLSDDDDISLNSTHGTSDEAEKIKAINVENAYMEEKEQAVLALKEICKHAPDAFYPHIYQSMEEVWKLMDFPDEDVRKAAVEAVVQFCIAYHNKGTKFALEGFSKAVANLVPKLCCMVREDDEVSVVCVCLDELAHILKKCGQTVTCMKGHPEQIIQCVHMVMKSECKCMDPDDFDQAEDNGHEAEQDEALFEYSGEVIPALGRAMPPSAFAPYFAGLLPHLLRKTKRQRTNAERVFSIGALAECMEPLNGVLDPFVSTLLNTFVHMLKDPDEDVRNNAVFGLGELAFHGGGSVHEHYPLILQNLSSLLSHEECGRVLDQVVGALCRLMVSNHDIVPVKEILSIVFCHLPLREDYDEYLIVFKCLAELHVLGEALVRTNIQQILTLAGTLAGNKDFMEGKEELQECLVTIVKLLYKDCNSEFAAIIGQLPPNVAESIAKIIG